jgi:homoserine dehydrogenase
VEVLHVGLAGFGTVGTGVAKILLEDSAWLQRRSGTQVRLKRIADLDLERDRGVSLETVQTSTRVEDILEDPDIEVFIELIGGIEPAKSFVLEAIAAKKHVVTANKALLASHGTELFQAAEEQGVQIGFEAAVAGGIPILRSLKEGVAADRIQSIAGIINGTANYILSTMTEQGREFPECLKEAQEKGYAEADPSLDIEGQDTAHKLSILIGLSCGLQVRPEEIYTEGIERITGMDIRYADELGYRIKLLALSKVQESELEARVHPTLIPQSHLLASVGHVFNAIYAVGQDTGPLMFYGKGAGMMPTGSAVVSDLISLARNLHRGLPQGSPSLGFYGQFPQEARLRRMEELVTKYYMRFPVVDRPGVLSSISGILGDHGISLHSVIQKGRQEAGPVHIIMLTHEAKERDVQRALEVIDRLEVVLDKSLFVRIEDVFDPPLPEPA